MTHQGRLVAGFAILAALAVGSLILWNSASNNEVAPPIFQATQGESGAAIPTVSSLMADPASLKAAAKACVDGAGTDVVTLCDRVHSAEAGLLAQKYRQGPAR